MAQMGFFDLSDRYASLGAKKDPLVEIDAVVPWEEFRPTLERVWRKPDADRKSRAGRKPMDAVLMFKTLVLSALYNLSDDQIEYQVRDPLTGRGLPANPERGLSFMRFLGLGLGDRVPDAKTAWLYRDALAQAGKVEELFRQFASSPVRQFTSSPVREFASLAVSWPGKAISRGVDKYWMHRLCQCRATTTRATKTQRSRRVRFPKIGKTSPLSDARKTRTRAG